MTIGEAIYRCFEDLLTFIIVAVFILAMCGAFDKDKS